MMSALMRTPLPYFLLLTLFACGPKPGSRPSEPALEDFYQRLKEPLDRMDLDSIKGKKIVIDPGHGGVFRGARGLGGLDEADVNLGVALYLWGLLEEAGAHVVLTRRTDRDFVDGDAGRLRDDLQVRVDTVLSVMPDVFVSLHHNAHFQGDRTFNEIQIYHKLRDTGPSLDLARIVARHVRGNLGDTNTRVLGGNYYVLRNSPVPSILCEPSFISNPAIESKLKLADKQRLEAEVYFVSLLDYFSRGTPEVVELMPAGTVTEARPEIRVAFSRTSTIDLASVSVLLDDEVLELSKIGPNFFSAFPTAPLESGRHTLQASARSTGGNSSPLAASVFMVDLEPEILALTATPEVGGRPYPQEITALVLDAYGNPVADSTSVSFSWAGGGTSEETLDGKASVFVGEDLPFGTARLTAGCGGLERTIDLEHSATAEYVSGFVRDAGGLPLEGAAVTSGRTDQAGGPGLSAVTDALGFFVLEASPGEMTLEVTKRGFRKAIATSNERAYPSIRLDTYFKSLASDIVVTVDAAGGGENTGWVGPTGVKASDLNLALARRLADLFSSAGIGVRLTRETDERVGPEERVIASESAGSTLLISLAHSRIEDGQVIVGHFPGSSGGNRLSVRLGEEIGRLPGYEPQITEIADYLLQQTSCPAVRIDFPVGNGVEDELDLTEALNTWTRAYAIFYATLEYLGIEEDATFTASGIVIADGGRRGGALVLIDGSLEILSDHEGRFQVRMLEEGNHIAEAFSGTRRSAPVAFDQDSDDLRLNLAHMRLD